jgi:hypothetical protein
VFWGSDGGISKTTNHDFTQSSINLNSIKTNLNGLYLHIGDMYDVDFDIKNELLTTAQYHGGYKVTDRNLNTVKCEMIGDGFNARVDKRYFNKENIIVRGNSELSVFEYVNPLTSIPNGNFVQPENYGWYRYSPMQFDEEYLSLGIQDVFKSQSALTSTGYGTSVGPLGWGNYFTAPNSSATNFTTTRNTSKLNVQFKIAPSDPTIAYNLMHGTNKVFLLTKGVFSGSWNWNLDRTPAITSINYNYDPITGPVSAYLNDLEINPYNADIIYVAVAGLNINSAAGNAGIDRVIKSTDGGTTWQDMSTGLSELPVNCLLYQSGSDDVIYAGTDRGVYFWHKPSQCWIQMNGNMAACMVTRLRIDYCRGKLMAATYGRGVWESDLLNFNPNNGVSIPGITNTISTNTLWDRNKIIEGSILIKQGATLTIQGTANANTYTSTTTIHMPNYGAIYVEKGAKLIVDGAKITNDCDVLWYGIQAFGNGTSPQNFSAGYYPNQGFVEIINEGIIQNAEEAFTNAGGTDLWNTGGIIYTNNAIFRNNRRSAAFLKYENIQLSGTLSRDLSTFRNTKFVIDDATYHNSPMVTMWAVRGVEFEGCIFTNGTNLDKKHEDGIYTLDASYWIHNSADRVSVFEGLEKAVHSVSYNWANKSQFPIEVNGAKFDKNEIGKDLYDLHLPVIQDNTFNTGSIQRPFNAASDWYPSIGTRFNNVANYIYCKNKHFWLYPTPNANVYTWNCGLDITNSGPDDVLVEKNKFTGMQIGVCVAAVNGNDETKTGLNFRWNKHVDNLEYDFVFGGDAIIRKIQTANLTTNNVATGNEFTAGIPNWWHWPGGNSPVDYYFNTFNTLHNPINNLNVNTIATTNTLIESEECERYITMPRARNNEISMLEFNVMKTAFYNAENDYNGLKSLYSQLLDGGNTEALEQNIENANSAEAAIIRTDMLAKSPYLSTDILTTLAEENLLSQGVLLEIILANPEGSKNTNFINYLQFEKPNPMPVYMINLIKGTWAGETVRSLMEKSMMQYLYIMETNKRDIITASRINTNLQAEDSVLTWLKKVSTLQGQYQVIEFYLAKQQYTQAEVVLNNIPLQFELNVQDAANHTAYTTFYYFKKDVQQNNISIHKLDSTRLENLKAIADATDATFARSMARNTLCFFYKHCYTSPSNAAITTTANKIATEVSTYPNNPVYSYPNPAKDLLTIEFNFDNTVNAQTIIITDMVGNKVKQVNLSTGVKIYNMDVHDLAIGLYTYTVLNNANGAYTGKFNIIK